MCNTFIKIVCVIILILTFLINALGHLFGLGDLVPSRPCPFEPTTEVTETTTEFVTEPVTEPATEPATTAPTTVPTTLPATVPTTAPTTITTTNTTTTATNTTTTTRPTTTTTKPTTTESGPFLTEASEVSLKIFGGDGDDVFRGAAALPTGGYVACGTSTSSNGNFASRVNSSWKLPFSFIVKYGKTGNVSWIKTIGSTSGGVTLEDITVLSDGSIAAVGYTEANEYAANADSKGSTDALIIRLAADGSSMTTQSFGGTGTDIFKCVEATSTGIAIGGKTDSRDGDFDGLPGSSAILMNLASDGSVIWKRYLSGNKGGTFNGISVDESGNVFAACVTASVNGDFAAFEELSGGYIDTVVIKYNNAGDYQWDFVISTSGRDEFTAVAADGKGGCVIGGNYELINTVSADGTLDGIHNCGGIDALVFRLDSHGDKVWTRILSGFDDDFITDIVKVGGGFAVTGYTASSNREFEGIGNSGGYDGFVCFMSKAGSTVKTFSQAGSADDIASCAAASADGEVLVLGRTKSSDGSFLNKNTYKQLTSYASRYKTACA